MDAYTQKTKDFPVAPISVLICLRFHIALAIGLVLFQSCERPSAYRQANTWEIKTLSAGRVVRIDTSYSNADPLIRTITFYYKGDTVIETGENTIIRGWKK